MLDYQKQTLASGDPLRRLSHGSRFRISASLANIPKDGHVLDFGGGDGAFLNSLLRTRRFKAVLFEPYMRVAAGSVLDHVGTWDDVASRASERPFDIVFCHEVMEHFSAQRQEEGLARIASVMAPDGRLILSVSVEMGPIALFKNIGRWRWQKSNKEIYTYRNLLRSLFGWSVDP